MTNHMAHPDLLDDFVKLQNQFLKDVLFEYTNSEIIDWLSTLSVEDISSILKRDPNLKSNGFIVPFLFIRYKAIPRREIVNYLRTLLNDNQLIPKDNPVLKKTITNFNKIFSERSDFRYR